MVIILFVVGGLAWYLYGPRSFPVVISLEPRICVVSPFRVRSRRGVDIFQCSCRRCICHLWVDGTAAFAETSINLNWVAQPVFESRSDELDSICESPRITVMESVRVMLTDFWYILCKLLGVRARKSAVGTCVEHTSFQAFAAR